MAARHRVRDTQIEKDYVLSWLLFSISKQPHLQKILVFKGGTALKKVWFENYRFSEDLDFTLLDDAFADAEEARFRKGWENKLRSQIHELPPFETVFRGAKRHFKLV